MAGSKACSAAVLVAGVVRCEARGALQQCAALGSIHLTPTSTSSTRVQIVLNQFVHCNEDSGSW